MHSNFLLKQAPTFFSHKNKKTLDGFLFLVEQSGLSPVRPYPTNSGCPLFGALHKLLKTIFSLMQVPPFCTKKQPVLGLFLWWSSRDLHPSLTQVDLTFYVRSLCSILLGSYPIDRSKPRQVFIDTFPCENRPRKRSYLI